MSETGFREQAVVLTVVLTVCVSVDAPGCRTDAPVAAQGHSEGRLSEGQGGGQKSGFICCSFPTETPAVRLTGDAYRWHGLNTPVILSTRLKLSGISQIAVYSLLSSLHWDFSLSSHFCQKHAAFVETSTWWPAAPSNAETASGVNAHFLSACFNISHLIFMQNVKTLPEQYSVHSSAGQFMWFLCFRSCLKFTLDQIIILWLCGFSFTYSRKDEDQNLKSFMCTQGIFAQWTLLYDGSSPPTRPVLKCWW